MPVRPRTAKCASPCRHVRTPEHTGRVVDCLATCAADFQLSLSLRSLLSSTSEKPRHNSYFALTKYEETEQAFWSATKRVVALAEDVGKRVTQVSQGPRDRLDNEKHCAEANFDSSQECRKCGAVFGG